MAEAKSKMRAASKSGKRDIDDLNSLLAMTTYIFEELTRIAPWAAILAGMLRSAISTEIAAKQNFIDEAEQA